MPKYEFNIEMTVKGEPSDIRAIAVYDHTGTGYNQFVEIYEVYIKIGLNRPNIYLDGLLTDDQYNALEKAIIEEYE